MRTSAEIRDALRLVLRVDGPECPEIIDLAEMVLDRVAELEGREARWDKALGARVEEVADLQRKVAGLEGERAKALDMVRDRLDADPQTMTEAVDGLTKLYKMEHDERFKLQAQLDRANEKMAAFRQSLDAEGARVDELKQQLDRATEPRVDGDDQ